MNAVLICPGERPQVPLFQQSAPLVLISVLGKPVLDYWLEYLTRAGAKKVRILASDRPEQIRDFVGEGGRWGLSTEVHALRQEPSLMEARKRYRLQQPDEVWLPEPLDTVLLEHLPGEVQHPLFDSYEGFFRAVEHWFPKVMTPERIGLRSFQPGIVTGTRTRISSQAVLHPPCFVGQDAVIGPDTVIGPNGYVEERSIVEAHAEVVESHVGPETFLGMLTELRDSLAWGNQLVNWKRNSRTEVPDAFLMCSFAEHRVVKLRGTLAGRFLAMLILVITSPLFLMAAFKAALSNRPVMTRKTAVCPQEPDRKEVLSTFTYCELTVFRGWWRRWPQLWNVVKGEFAWVGNRPLSPDLVEHLADDYERLWLAVPIGLFSLAEAEGCTELFSDEARARASYYAVQANWRLDFSIITRTFENCIRKVFF